MSNEVEFVYTGGDGQRGRPVAPKNVTHVTLDPSVKVIGEFAFYYCTSLISVDIPTSVTTIGESAFYSCTSLVSVDIPISVTTIGGSAFHGCTSFVSGDIPKCVTTIGDYAFYSCTSLVSVVIPTSVTTIGIFAFYVCTSLVSVDIPTCVTSISDNAFDGCTLLGQASKTKGVSVNEFTKTMYNDLPLHRICGSANVSVDKITQCLKSNKSFTAKKDALQLSALSILSLNTRVTFDMIKVLVDADKIPLSEKDIAGSYPLHRACSNVNMDIDIIKLMVESAPESIELVDGNNAVPLNAALLIDTSEDIQNYLFATSPINISQLFRVKPAKLYSLVDKYISESITMSSLTLTNSFDKFQQNGWVNFITVRANMNVEEGQNVVQKITNFIGDCEEKIVEKLAYFKDFMGRLAFDYAIPEIKVAIQERLLFLGRYDFVKGPPLHKSATCVVLKAYDEKAEDDYRKMFIDFAKEKGLKTSNISLFKDDFKSLLKELGVDMKIELLDETFAKWDKDNDRMICEQEFVDFCKTDIDKGRRNEVAIKLMLNKDQYLREISSREKTKMSTNFVIGINNRYDGDSNNILAGKETFLDAVKNNTYLQSKKYNSYKYALVMPCADRNLDGIFRSERPTDIQILEYSTQIAQAIQHLHEKKIIHGDLKLLNIVRYQERLRLIDLDASTKISENDSKAYTGAKFSSGVLPPEMITSLNMDEYKTCKKHFIMEPKSAPKLTTSKTRAYSVKTFFSRRDTVDGFEGKLNIEVPEHAEELPYTLEEATPAIDIWGFGNILFTLYTNSTLFKVNRDDDLENGDAMEELYTWNESKLKVKLNLVKNSSAKELLSRLLSNDKDKRYQSMDEVLVAMQNISNNNNEILTKLEKIGVGLEIGLEKIDVGLEVSLQKIDVGLEKINVKTDIILSMSDETLKKISESTSVLCKAIFEGTEVKTPTCFVILPDEIGPSVEDCENDEIIVDSKHLENVDKYMWSCLDLVTKFPEPFEFAKNYFENKIKTTMFLYLVDEHTGQPVYDSTGVYPIEIGRKKKAFEKILPIFMLGIQTMAIANKATGLINMFYPGLPSKIIPKELLEKAETFARDSSLRVIKEAWNQEGKGIAKRGGPLREFERFLELHDSDRTYSSLKRVCNKDGDAIWITEKSHHDIEKERNDEKENFKSEIDKLKTEKKELQTEKNEIRKEFQTENDNLKKKIDTLKNKNSGCSCTIS